MNQKKNSDQSKTDSITCFETPETNLCAHSNANISNHLLLVFENQLKWTSACVSL